MFTALLIIIYVAFISLGLPDSILGSAWPVMQQNLGVPSSYAGFVTMIISFMTVVSSLMSDRLNRKLGAGKVTAISVLMTAFSLLGFSLSTKFYMLCLIAVPYGLGAGAIDAALNNYVALHYSSRHMSWLHMSWGIGAFTGPLVMGQFLVNGFSWKSGYFTIAVFQFVLSAIIIFTLPLWKKVEVTDAKKNGVPASDSKSSKALSFKEIISIPGGKSLFLAFLSYSAIESTIILWAPSFISQTRGITATEVASYGALYTLGITIGRFLSGFISDKLGDRNMIRLGCGVILIALIIICVPVGGAAVTAIGLVLSGIGSGPIYPSIIHSTPSNFGADKSQALIGVQMAFAYIGTTFCPPVFGFLAQTFTVTLFPVYLVVFFVLMFMMSEMVNRITGKVAS